MSHPKVGLGVIVIRDGKVLLAQRTEDHGQGTWCFPGGHLELGESWEDCAYRETAEESGIKIKNVYFATATNDIFDDHKHYITIYMMADHDAGEPSNVQVEEVMNWGWFAWDDLPQPLFKSLENLIKSGYRPKNL